MGYLISVPADFNDVSIVLLCFFDVFCYILMGYLISVPGVPNKTVPVGYPIKRTPYLIKRTHGYLITVPVGSFIRYFRVVLPPLAFPPLVLPPLVLLPLALSRSLNNIFYTVNSRAPKWG